DAPVLVGVADPPVAGAARTLEYATMLRFRRARHVAALGSKGRARRAPRRRAFPRSWGWRSREISPAYEICRARELGWWRLARRRSASRMPIAMFHKSGRRTRCRSPGTESRSSAGGREGARSLRRRMADRGMGFMAGRDATREAAQWWTCRPVRD